MTFWFGRKKRGGINTPPEFIPTKRRIYLPCKGYYSLEDKHGSLVYRKFELKNHKDGLAQFYADAKTAPARAGTQIAKVLS